MSAKVVLGAGDALGDDDAGVVARLDDDAADQVVDADRRVELGEHGRAAGAGAALPPGVLADHELVVEAELAGLDARRRRPRWSSAWPGSPAASARRHPAGRARCRSPNPSGWRGSPWSRTASRPPPPRHRQARQQITAKKQRRSADASAEAGPLLRTRRHLICLSATRLDGIATSPAANQSLAGVPSEKATISGDHKGVIEAGGIGRGNNRLRRHVAAVDDDPDGFERAIARLRIGGRHFSEA